MRLQFSLTGTKPLAQVREVHVGLLRLGEHATGLFLLFDMVLYHFG